MSYPIPFGKSHHYDSEVDFRYLDQDQQEQALADGWSPPIEYLSTSGFFGDVGQTYSVIKSPKISAISSEQSPINTSHDGLSSAKVWNKN